MTDLIERMTEQNEYWVVQMTIGFGTEAEAKAFEDKLTDAFCAMPEAEGIGCTTTVTRRVYPAESEQQP